MFPLILLSPSKTLYEPGAFSDQIEQYPSALVFTKPEEESSGPVDHHLTQALLQGLGQLDLSSLQTYYQISQNVAHKVASYYDQATPSQPMWTWYTGEAFKYLDLPSFHRLGGKVWQRVASNLVVLSALYGAHRPLDSMRPYRLDFTLPLPPGFDPKPFAKANGQKTNESGPYSLRSLWEPRIQSYLSDLANQQSSQVFLSCASEEFESLVFGPGGRILPFGNQVLGTQDRASDFYVIRIEFFQKHPKTGEKTKISARAKQARGALARWVLVNAPDEFSSLDDMLLFLRGFMELEYTFDSIQEKRLTQDHTSASVITLTFSQ